MYIKYFLEYYFNHVYIIYYVINSLHRNLEKVINHNVFFYYNCSTFQFCAISNYNTLNKHLLFSKLLLAIGVAMMEKLNGKKLLFITTDMRL